MILPHRIHIRWMHDFQVNYVIFTMMWCMSAGARFKRKMIGFVLYVKQPQLFMWMHLEIAYESKQWVNRHTNWMGTARHSCKNRQNNNATKANRATLIATEIEERTRAKNVRKTLRNSSGLVFFHSIFRLKIVLKRLRRNQAKRETYHEQLFISNWVPINDIMRYNCLRLCRSNAFRISNVRFSTCHMLVLTMLTV